MSFKTGVWACDCVCLCVSADTHVFTYVLAHACVCVHASRCVHMHVWICLCVHVPVCQIAGVMTSYLTSVCSISLHAAPFSLWPLPSSHSRCSCCCDSSANTHTHAHTIYSLTCICSWICGCRFNYADIWTCFLGSTKVQKIQTSMHPWICIYTVLQEFSHTHISTKIFLHTHRECTTIYQAIQKFTHTHTHTNKKLHLCM